MVSRGVVVVNVDGDLPIVTALTHANYMFFSSLLSPSGCLHIKSPLGEKYTFFNKGYRYEYYHGWSRGGQLEVLYVYDADETLVYSGFFEPVQD